MRPPCCCGHPRCSRCPAGAAAAHAATGFPLVSFCALVSASLCLSFCTDQPHPFPRSLTTPTLHASSLLPCNPGKQQARGCLPVEAPPRCLLWQHGCGPGAATTPPAAPTLHIVSKLACRRAGCSFRREKARGRAGSASRPRRRHLVWCVARFKEGSNKVAGKQRSEATSRSRQVGRSRGRGWQKGGVRAARAASPSAPVGRTRRRRSAAGPSTAVFYCLCCWWSRSTCTTDLKANHSGMSSPAARDRQEGRMKAGMSHFCGKTRQRRGAGRRAATGRTAANGLCTTLGNMQQQHLLLCRGGLSRTLPPRHAGPSLTAAQHLAELGATQLLDVQPLGLRHVSGHVAAAEGGGGGAGGGGGVKAGAPGRGSSATAKLATAQTPPWARHRWIQSWSNAARNASEARKLTAFWEEGGRRTLLLARSPQLLGEHDVE